MSRAAEDNRDKRADREARARHRQGMDDSGRKVALRLRDRAWKAQRQRGARADHP